MALANLIVAVRTAGANSLRQLGGGIRGIGTAARASSAAVAASTRDMQRQYDQVTREITRLQPQLARARTAQARLTREAHDTAREVRRIEDEIQRVGTSNALERQLRQARRAADGAALAVVRIDRDVHGLNRSLQRATNQAQGLQRALNNNNIARNSMIGQLVAGFRGTSGIRDAVSRAWQAVPTEAKAVIIAAGAAMAVFLADAIGAALNAALLAAVGGAVLGGMVAVAVKTSKGVQDAFKGVFAEVKTDVTNFSRAADDDLLGVAESFRGVWRDVSGDVREAFQTILPVLKPLAAGLGDMIRNTMPGFKEAIAAAVPVLKELARDLPAIGTAASDFFSSLAHGEGSVKGMRALMVLLSGTLTATGDVIEFLSDQFNGFTNMVEAVLTALSKIPVLGRLFKESAAEWQAFNQTGESGILVMDAAGAAATGAGAGTSKLSDAARKASDEVRKLSDQLGGMINSALGASNATIAWEAALDALTDSVKANGRNIDIGTEKGRENVKAVNEAIEAALRKRDADIALAGGENASADAVNAANAKFRDQIGQLEATLLKMGFTRAQVDALLASYKAMAAAPNIVKYVDLYYRTHGTAAKDFQVPGATIGSGNLHFNAAGTPSAVPGWSWVGEQGPELMRLRGGEQILNARQSAAMAAGRGGAGGVIQAQLVPTGGPRSSSDWLTGAFNEAIRAGRIRLVVKPGSNLVTAV